jgi:hypothetical protein
MARTMTDIGLEGNEDLLIADGDFRVEESTAQHQIQLLLNNKGDFKEHPTTCIGAFNFFDDENFRGLVREVHIEFSRDGMLVHSVDILPEGIINTEAIYR